MEKKQIPIIALAVFSIFLLVGYDYQRVYALVSAQDFNFGSSNNQVFYQSSIDTYVILQSTTGSASTRITFLEASSETPSVDQVSFTIFPQQGGCDVDPTDGINYNPCSATSGATDCDTDFIGADACSNKTGLTGDFAGLWCGLTYCYILFDQTSGGWSSQLIRIWSLGVGSSLTGDVSGYMNITSTWDLHGDITGFDESGVGIGGITVFYVYIETATSQAKIDRVGGTSIMGSIGPLSTLVCVNSGCLANTNGFGSLALCRNCSGVGTYEIMYANRAASSVASRQIVIFDETGTTAECSINPNTIGVATTNTAVVSVSPTNDYFIMASDSEIHQFSFLCVETVNYTYASISLENYVRDIDVDDDNDLYYIWHGSIQPLATITQMNLTTFTTTSNFDSTVGSTISGWVDGGQPIRSMALGIDERTILITTDSTRARIIYLEDFIGESDEPAGSNQQDGFCGNGTLRDCLGDQDALSGLTPPNQNITSVATTIGQGIGLINPNDENPRTNGTGLWLMLITGSFFAIALMSTVHTLNMRGFISASVKEIDPIFWLFLVVATVSIAWYLDWIDDIIFFAMTVGLAGLVAFGVLKHFGRI